MDEPEYDLDSSRITVADKQSAILFHPYSDMYEVLVKAEVVSKAPPLDPDKWDHIVEASLKGDRLFEGRRNKGPSLYELRLLNS